MQLSILRAGDRISRPPARGLEAADSCRYRDHPKVHRARGVHEFPGRARKDPDCLAKLAAFQGAHIDGHAPLLRGLDLNGYLAAGIRTDHEATTAEEALEKIRKGMTVLIREGSVSKDLHALAPLITDATVAVHRASAPTTATRSTSPRKAISIT